MSRTALLSSLVVVVLLTGLPVGLFAADCSTITLHVVGYSNDNTCSENSPLATIPPTPCSQFTTKGDLGEAYNLYMVAVRPNGEGVGQMGFGISYDGATGQGVDVRSWTSCADLEFTSGNWPESGSGSRLYWVSTNCQTTVVQPDGVHAVAGVFYVYAYSADSFQVTKRQQANPPRLTVANCANIEEDIVVSPGRVDFSAGAVSPGYNPCVPATAPAAALALTSEWYAAANSLPDDDCPWVGFDNATPESPALSGGVLTLATSELTEDVYYQQATFLAVPDTFQISARLRVVSETHLAGNPRLAVGIGFTVGPDSANVLFLGHDSAFLWAEFGAQGPTASVDTDDAFHDYLIEVIDHCRIRVFQDDVMILAGAIAVSPYFANAAEIYWGDGTGNAHGVSEWTFVGHNASTDPCGNATGLGPDPRIEGPIPEPVVVLAPPFPNPARGEVSLSIHASGDLGDRGLLKIYDLAGRAVREIDAGPFSKGVMTLRWDTRNTRGETVANGVYLLRLESGGKAVGSGRAVVLR
jgi:hypothetical protein